MAYESTINQRIIRGNVQIDSSIVSSAGGQAGVDESIPDSSTDLAVGFTLDFSACKSFYMVSDQDITVETNDGTTPDDTFSLLAGVPYVWHTNSYDTFLVTADITALYVTNASGAAARLRIEALYDPTP